MLLVSARFDLWNFSDLVLKEKTVETEKKKIDTSDIFFEYSSFFSVLLGKFS